MEETLLLNAKTSMGLNISARKDPFGKVDFEATVRPEFCASFL
jgi:hypothetical protein